MTVYTAQFSTLAANAEFLASTPATPYKKLEGGVTQNSNPMNAINLLSGILANFAGTDVVTPVLGMQLMY